MLTDLGVARVLGETAAGEVTPRLRRPHGRARWRARAGLRRLRGRGRRVPRAHRGRALERRHARPTPSPSPPTGSCPTSPNWRPRRPPRTAARSCSGGWPPTPTTAGRRPPSRSTCGTPAGPSRCGCRRPASRTRRPAGDRAAAAHRTDPPGTRTPPPSGAGGRASRPAAARPSCGRPPTGRATRRGRRPRGGPPSPHWRSPRWRWPAGPGSGAGPAGPPRRGRARSPRRRRRRRTDGRRRPRCCVAGRHRTPATRRAVAAVVDELYGRRAAASPRRRPPLGGVYAPDSPLRAADEQYAAGAGRGGARCGASPRWCCGSTKRRSTGDGAALDAGRPVAATTTWWRRRPGRAAGAHCGRPSRHRRPPGAGADRRRLADRERRTRRLRLRQPPARAALSADSRSAWAKRNPEAVSFVGRARCPPSTLDRPNSPRARCDRERAARPARSDGAGSGRGSCVNSAFVAGSGPVRLTGPDTSVVSRCRMAPTSSVRLIHGQYWRPDAEAAAQPEPEHEAEHAHQHGARPRPAPSGAGPPARRRPRRPRCGLPLDAHAGEEVRRRAARPR